MKRFWLSLVGAGLLAATAAASCDYASRSDVQALTTKVQLLQDSLNALRDRTHSTLMAIVAFDTVPPPKCPPRCFEMVRSSASQWKTR